MPRKDATGAPAKSGRKTAFSRPERGRNAASCGTSESFGSTGSREPGVRLDYAEIKAGLEPERLRELLAEGAITRSDLAMVIPDRTLSRRMEKRQPLKLEESDAVARLVRVRDHARQAFEDPDLADQWLSSPNPELGDERPLDMARTDVGAREVEAVLTRFEQGVVG